MVFQYRDMNNAIHNVNSLTDIAYDYWSVRRFEFDLAKNTVGTLVVGDRLLLREGDTTENAHFTRVHELGGEPYCVADIVAIDQQPASNTLNSEAILCIEWDKPYQNGTPVDESTATHLSVCQQNFHVINHEWDKYWVALEAQDDGIHAIQTAMYNDMTITSIQHACDMINSARRLEFVRDFQAAAAEDHYNQFGSFCMNV